MSIFVTLRRRKNLHVCTRISRNAPINPAISSMALRHGVLVERRPHAAICDHSIPIFREAPVKLFPHRIQPTHTIVND